MKKLLKKIGETDGVAQKEGAGRPKSLSAEENIKLVEEIILSQEDQPGTHSTPAEIAHELDIDCHIIVSQCPICFPDTWFTGQYSSFNPNVLDRYIMTSAGILQFALFVEKHFQKVRYLQAMLNLPL